MARNMLKVKQSYISNLNTVTSFLLPEYEKNVYSIYVDNQEEALVFADKNSNELTEASEELVDKSQN